MNKYLIAFLALICFSFEAHAAPEKNTSKHGGNPQMNTAISARDWKHMYFLAITKKKPSEINLSQELMSRLLSMINVHSGISTGAAIEPKFLMNAKGTTVWLAMYALIASSNPESLKSLSADEGLLYIPSTFLNGAFGVHINWPEKMLQSHNLTLKDYNLIVIPFIVSNSVTNMKNMSQSLKAPDGSLQVFGFHEFNENSPEALLVEYETIVNFIIKENFIL
jgi:hypothetical protein